MKTETRIKVKAPDADRDALESIPRGLLEAMLGAAFDVPADEVAVEVATATEYSVYVMWTHTDRRVRKAGELAHATINEALRTYNTGLDRAEELLDAHTDVRGSGDGGLAPLDGQREWV